MNLNSKRISGGYNYVPRKLFLVMKIATFILLISVLTVSASTYAQKITLNEKKAGLDEVLAKIRQQSGYDVIYSNDVLEKSTPVTIKISNASLEEALKVSLLNQPLTYEIDDKTILIKMKEAPIIDKVKEIFAKIDITGRVIDEKGLPLPAATIKLKDESQVTSTDRSGAFLLRQVNDNAVVVISSIGYLTKELNAKSEMGTIALEISNSKLDEVQVIAYGTTSQRLSTGNISTVKGADIAKSPVQNPILALQGRVSGLFIEQSSGLANSGVKIRIQGQNSLSKGNNPFYVIDGVPYPSQLLPSLGNILGSSGNSSETPSGAGNPLSFINPNDIESIDILKDGDATAIYGSRAANGAILITTKKGRYGKTKVDINVQQGIGKVSKMLKLLNTDQYLQIRNEAYKNDKITPGSDPNDFFSYAPDLKIWNTSHYTDWQKELIGGSSHYTNAQLSISGGSEILQYIVGGSYKRETTVFPGTSNDQKGSFHYNLNNSSSNQRFKFNFSGNYLIDNNQLPLADFTNRAILMPPNAPNLLNRDGSLNFSLLPNGNASFDNPLRYLKQTVSLKTKNLLLSGNLSYVLTKGLKIGSNFGYNDLQTNENFSYPKSSYLPQDQPNAASAATYLQGNINSWLIEPQLTYNTNLFKGNVEILLGSTFQQNTNTGQSILGTGYVSDSSLGDINSASTLSKNGSTASNYKYNALFGRINYNWNDRYIVNITARRDGSSRFGSENKLHNFGSIAGAWLFSNENFLKDSKVLSFGKIKASYGWTGNDQIGDYQYLSLYSPVTVVNRSYQGVSGFQPNGLPNPYLQWEETRKFQVGLDLGFFKDRILLSTSYSINHSSNQLSNSSLPLTTGFTGIQTNLPANIENRTAEFNLNTTNIRKGNVTWTSNFNLTLPQNKLASFTNIDRSSFANSLVVGKSINLIKTYEFAGVNPTTGLYQFIDKNGNLTSAPGSGNDNKTVILDRNPAFYGGLANTITYGNFQLDFLFQFVKQIAPNYHFGNIPGSIAANQPLSVLDRWQKPGDNKEYEQYTAWNFDVFDVDGFALASNRAYSDASYIRLKNLSFSYKLPALLLKSLNVNSLRLYLQGQNLLTITNYEGLDPETKSINSLPSLRMITAGIQITL